MVVCPVGMKLFNRVGFFLNMHLNGIQLPGWSLELRDCLVAQCSHDGAHLDRWTQCNQIPFCFRARLSSRTFMNALYMCTLMSCLIKSELLNIKGPCAR